MPPIWPQTECKNDITCNYCAEKHNTNECKKEEYNEECQIYKNKINRLVERINYNTDTIN